MIRPARPLLNIVRKPGRALRRNRRFNAGAAQLIYVIAGVVLGLATPEVDAGFTVQGDDVRTFLIAVGAGILPFIGIVYSLLFLVVQFGTTTFTPRLNIFRDSPIVWHSFGFFTGVLVFCFTAAFALADEEKVSGAVAIFGVLLMLAALAVFRALQTSAFQSIQLASALTQVGGRGREVVLGIHPDELDPDSAAVATPPDWRAESPAGQHGVRWPRESMVLQVIDVPHLLKLATENDVLIECVVGTGETIPERGVMVRVHGGLPDGLEEAVLNSMTAGPERTFEQDPSFAFRVLADIALRALSPAVNDPTTATQALDATDSLLRLLAGRDLDVGCIRDEQGVLRVVLKLPGWDEYVALAIDEVMFYSLNSSQVRRRLERLLTELLVVAPGERRPAIEARLAQLTTPTFAPGDAAKTA